MKQARSDNMYDAVIIGAGISGLVCGCYLAKAGLKVLIAEQHDKPGGYFTSFKRRGFVFDAAAHSFGNYRRDGHVKKIFSEIGVSNIIPIKRYDPSDVVVTPDYAVTFWNDKDRTVEDLSRCFPEEKKNIVQFINFVTSSDRVEFSKLKEMTFGSLLQKFFSNTKLINIIAFPVFGNGGLPPSLMHAFSGTKIFSEFILDGGYYPGGCIQDLSNALARIVENQSGKVLYRCPVKKIIVRNNVAAGVRLEDNEKILSRYVISACDMTQTYKEFLGRKYVGSQIQSLRRLTPSMSTFILYLGIDGPFPGMPDPGVNSWYLPYYDLDEMYRKILKCEFSKVGMMLRVSPDMKTILGFFGAPYRSALYWKQNKRKIAQDFLMRIEGKLPNIESHIVYSDSASPATLCRYTMNHKGAAFGWAKLTSQIYDIFSHKAISLQNLYLTGHWTSIGFGMPGTCYSGYDTARRILRKEKIL